MTELPAGRFVGLFGIRGELKCDPTSAGRTLFVRGARFVSDGRDGRREVRIASVREHKGRLLVRLEGVEDATAAEPYANATLSVERERLEAGLGDGEYLDVDLVGCALLAPDGSELGTVTAVMHYPSSDMLVVNGRLVPLVGAFVREIDVASKRIVADLPAGLLDDGAAETDG